jgi:demethylmenaquinone methyltransferase/2-methoxy-6-polyprenyl-1,4-benzoquinol methylase
MSDLTGVEREKYVQVMFGRIAARYDLLNRLMTFGQDVHWRKDAIRHLAIAPKAAVLDLGSGTGDIAFEITRQHPDALVVASDFTAEMVAVGKQRPGGDRVNWVIADAQRLPFAKESFSGTISGFLLRNVPDINRTLAEQKRVLKADGRIAALDTTPPRKNILRPFLNVHLRYIVPLLGRLIAGDAEAYTYLPSSTEKFLDAETLAERFQAAGFTQVGFVRRMLGTIGIHWGKKK